jgi:ATPase subunit of ABC transporter with duplicated ATPase domains
LFDLPEGAIDLGGGRELRYSALSMRPDDHIAITGPNGSGKSTLVRHIVVSLNLPEERVTYLPQEIDLGASQKTMDNARALPKGALGHMMTVVSRLGSRPQRLLETAEPSPGEIRKVLLATGIARKPHLIIMDEPTNHLDLPSIECLENALRDCPCGLLLVSHDRRFLDALTAIRWHITPVEEEENIFALNVIR